MEGKRGEEKDCNGGKGREVEKREDTLKINKGDLVKELQKNKTNARKNKYKVVVKENNTLK